MEPPTCTVLVRLVRTTAAVATWPLPPDEEAVLLSLPPLAAAATPPATTPPTRAPATAAMATTCRAETSAIGTRPGAARHGSCFRAPVLGVGTGRSWEGVVHSRRLDFDVSRCR